MTVLAVLTAAALAGGPALEVRGASGFGWIVGPRAAVFDRGKTVTVDAGLQASTTVVGVRVDLAAHDGMYYEQQADEGIDPTQRAQGDSVFIGAAAAIAQPVYESTPWRFDIRGAVGVMAVPLRMPRERWEEDVLRIRWGGVEDPGIHNGVHPYVVVGFDGELRGDRSPIGIGGGAEIAYGVDIGPWLALRAMVRFHSKE